MSSIQSLFSQAQTLSLVLNKEVAEIDQIRCGEHPDGSRPMNFSTHMRGFGAPQSHGYLPQNPEQIDLIYRKSEIVKSNMAELTSIISRLKVLAAHEGPRKEIWLSYVTMPCILSLSLLLHPTSSALYVHLYCLHITFVAEQTL